MKRCDHVCKIHGERCSYEGHATFADLRTVYDPNHEHNCFLVRESPVPGAWPVILIHYHGANGRRGHYSSNYRGGKMHGSGERITSVEAARILKTTKPKTKSVSE